MLNENTLIKSLPEVLCLSDEFLERGVKSIEESKELKRLETLVLFNLIHYLNF